MKSDDSHCAEIVELEIIAEKNERVCGYPYIRVYGHNNSR